MALGLCTFALYQIRPNLALVTILVPIWAVAIAIIFERLEFRRIRSIFFRYVSITVIPLLLFCLLRLVVVGQFGVVSFSGVALSGHATYFLNENNVKQLSGESRVIGEEILKRKRKLDYPANLSPFRKSVIPGRSKYSMQNESHSSLCMTSWLVAIKQKTGLEPFDDPEKNIKPWQHVQTLSGFFSIYNADIDKLLMNYAKDIIKLEWKQYLAWIAVGSYEGIKVCIKVIITRPIRQIWIFFLTIILIARALFFKRRRPLKLETRRWFNALLLISIFGLSLFLVNVIPIAMFSCVKSHYLHLFLLYLFPVVTLWCMPPVCLDNKWE